jgi:hypothetical protein
MKTSQLFNLAQISEAVSEKYHSCLAIIDSMISKKFGGFNRCSLHRRRCTFRALSWSRGKFPATFSLASFADAAMAPSGAGFRLIHTLPSCGLELSQRIARRSLASRTFGAKYNVLGLSAPCAPDAHDRLGLRRCPKGTRLDDGCK